MTTVCSSIATVHPHGRGDNDDYYLVAIRRNGSPPRAWGQWRRAAVSPHLLRFTPTGVGTIRFRRRAAACSSVHPHGRGDNCSVADLDRAPYGSPPRAWGQLMRGVADGRVARFTPTGVGTIPSGSRRGPRYPGSPPRAWGQCSVADLDRAPYGSPPRAWGQFDDTLAAHTLLRFTPTGVGTMRCKCCVTSNPSGHPHGRGDNASSRRVGIISLRFTPTGVGTISGHVPA